MKKKNIKVKKGNGETDISITIENNLNANNKQINNNNNNPIKRRRKKKVENNDEINPLEELPPLTDTSYIKPGPVGVLKCCVQHNQEQEQEQENKRYHLIIFKNCYL